MILYQKEEQKDKSEHYANSVRCINQAKIESDWRTHVQN